MQKNPNFTNMLILLFLTMSIFSILYNYEEVYGIEFTESEWGIKLKIEDPWKLSSNSNNYNNLCDSNNKFKCLIVLDNALLDKLSSITIFAEKGQDFKNKCQCASLLEFIQYDYNRSYITLKNSFLIGDNQTVLNGNVSAWQMEYNIINKNNIMNHLITWTMVHDIFYIISYHGEEDIYSKYLPSVKEFINTIEFVIPKNDSQSLSKDNLPSFMTINNTKEEKKKQPSFMITENTTESNILQKEKPAISAKEPNEGLTTEDLVNETIALENQTINETILGRQEKQEQGSTSLEEQLKLAQEKLNQLGLGSFSDSSSQSLDKQAKSVREKINQTYQVENTRNWIIGESGKLSFMYPSHWNVNVSSSRFDNYELLFRDKASNASIQVSDEAIKPTEKVFMRTDPKEYVDFYMKFNLPLSSDASKIETYPKGKVSIAGLPAYSELYLDKGYAILISLAFPEGNDRHYTVFSASPSSKYDKLEPIMLEIIKSITPKTIQKPSDQEIEIPSNNTDFGNNQDAEELKTTTEGAKDIGKNITEGAKKLAETIGKGLQELAK